MTPTELKNIVQYLLKNINDAETIKKFCTPDVTYVSLNYNNPDLYKVMPWCGTWQGPEGIIKT